MSGGIEDGRLEEEARTRDKSEVEINQILTWFVTDYVMTLPDGCRVLECVA